MTHGVESRSHRSSHSRLRAEDGDAASARPGRRRHRLLDEQLRRDLQAIFTERADRSRGLVGVGPVAEARRDALQPQPVPYADAGVESEAADHAPSPPSDSGGTTATRPRSTPPERSTATAHLDGDLVIVARTATRRSTRGIQSGGAIFDAWAKQLCAKGIRPRQRSSDRRRQRVRRARLGPRLGVGRPRLRLWRRGRRAAIQREPGRAAGRPGPGSRRRAPSSAFRLPAAAHLDHEVTTAAAGQPSRITLLRPPGSDAADGQRPGGARFAGDHRATRPSTNPTLVYLNALRDALGRHGVFVGGTSARYRRCARQSPDMSQATLLVEDKSPPLAEIIDVTPEVEPQHLRGNDAAIDWRRPARRKPRPSGPHSTSRDAQRLGHLPRTTTWRETARAVADTTTSLQMR